MAIHVLDSHRYLAVHRVLQVLPWPERIVWMEGAVDLHYSMLSLGSRKRTGIPVSEEIVKGFQSGDRRAVGRGSFLSLDGDCSDYCTNNAKDAALSSKLCSNT
jgi:hypothetical protein